MRRLPEQANYRDWRARQLQAYTTLETRETWWYLPDGRSLHVVCEQHPFGGVTYLYENATKEIQLESRYNELIGVQRETLDNLHEGVALFGTDGRLKLYNPAFARFWSLDPEFLDRQPHVDRSSKPAADPWPMTVRVGRTQIRRDRASIRSRKPAQGRLKRPDGLALEFASVPLARRQYASHLCRRHRLSAEFFWDLDRKTKLEDRVPALAQRIFHAKLGTMAEKVDRIEKIAVDLAQHIPNANAEHVRRAARLCKADLSSGMVGEFPELQGIMVRYYALGEGEKAEVADAIRDHYSPLGPNDRCPSAPVSIAVALADKIDSAGWILGRSVRSRQDRKIRLRCVALPLASYVLS